MNKSSGSLEINYAYLKGGSSEIGVANISLVIGNEELLLVISVNDAITESDLEQLLKNLQSQPFNKMRLLIAKDCSVILNQPTGEYTVSFEQDADTIKIAGIIPVER